jgi:hypothetical protein
MTKFCPECGAKLKDDANFCINCGLNLNECEQDENSINSPKSKSNGFLSFLDDWSEWSAGKKIGFIILVCCIGLIVIGAIAGILFPDLNTSEHRFYMTSSSFVIPDDCDILEGGEEVGAAILVREDGSKIAVFDFYPPTFGGGEIIDSNETINADGVNINKIKYHFNDGSIFIDYYFNKDNIDYCVVFDQNIGIDDNLVISIAKSMDTEHGNSSNHENVYPSSGSSSNSNNGHEDLYDSYTGSSSSNPSNDKSSSDSSNRDDNVGNSEVQVRITCNGGWSGSIGVGTSSSTYSGNGDKIINLDGSSSDIVSVCIQKQSDGNGKLKVEIIKGGNVKKEASTTSGYGVVTVAD